MRHGILAFVGVLTLICLAVGDEPKKLDPANQEAAETDDGTNDLDTEIDELRTKLQQLVKQNFLADETRRKHERVVGELIHGMWTQLHELQAEQKRRSEKPDDPVQRIKHIRTAAKHLKAAGMHDQMMELLAKADEMEREVSTSAMDQDEIRRQRDDLWQRQDRRRQLAFLMRENERLQQEVQELDNLMLQELRSLMPKE